MFYKAKRDISDDAICCPRATRCNTNPFSRAVRHISHRRHIACITHIANPNGIYIAKQKICYHFGQQILLFYKELAFLDSCLCCYQQKREWFNDNSPSYSYMNGFWQHILKVYVYQSLRQQSSFQGLFLYAHQHEICLP